MRAYRVHPHFPPYFPTPCKQTHEELRAEDGKDEEEDDEHDGDVGHRRQAQHDALEHHAHAGGAREHAQGLDGTQCTQTLSVQGGEGGVSMRRGLMARRP